MEEVLNARKIISAQDQLDRELRAELPAQGPHRLGYRGGGQTLDLYSQGRGSLYYASVFIDRPDTTHRYWNAFGFYDGNPHSTQRIAVEINIPNPPSRQVAAFFAQNTESGDVLLLHSGRMGGGKEGVTRAGFLRHSRLQLTSVRSGGRQRQAIVVAKLGDPHMVHDIESFTRAVAVYKESLN